MSIEGYRATLSCPRCGELLEHVSIPALPHKNTKGGRTMLSAVCSCPACRADFRLCVFLWPAGEEKAFQLQPALEKAGVDIRDWDSDFAARGPLKLLASRVAAATGEKTMNVYQKLRRWARDGITATQADELAIALGNHPSEIWPDWYERTG